MVNSEDGINAEKLPSIEFDQTWFMPYTYFGPSLVKPFPDKSCHKLFAEANLQSSRVIGSHKRKKENYPGRINTKITYVSRTKTALRHARDSDSKVLHSGIKDNCIQMDTVTMHSHKSTFDMIVWTITHS